MEIIETRSGHGRILRQLAVLADSLIVPEEALRLVPEPLYRLEDGPPSLPRDRRLASLSPGAKRERDA